LGATRGRRESHRFSREGVTVALHDYWWSWGEDFIEVFAAYVSALDRIDAFPRRGEYRNPGLSDHLENLDASEQSGPAYGIKAGDLRKPPSGAAGSSQ